MGFRGSRARQRVLIGVFGALATAFLAGCTDYAAEINKQSPLPFYNVEWTSGGRSGTVAGDAVMALGAPVVPKPIDVNGDNIPDVEVALNVVDLATVVSDVQAGKTIVPNIVFKRPITSVASPAPPLKIEVVVALPGNVNIRFGYDTRRGGAIPTHLKATLIGFETGFKPFGAILDTTNPSPTGEATTSYDGPLALIGSIRTGNDTLGLDMNFSPLPRKFRVDYSEDTIPTGDLEGGTRHIKYRDLSSWGSADKTVDLDAVVNIGKHGQPKPDTVITAAIERLAAQTELHLDLRGQQNSIDYKGVSHLAPPDAIVDVVSNGDDPMDIDLELVGLPESVRAQWTSPPDGISNALVTGSGNGIASASARIANYLEGDPADPYRPFTAFRPDSRMFAEVRQNQSDDSLLQARVENLRRFSFDKVGKETHIGLDANDGLPMRVKVESDGRRYDRAFLDADLVTSGIPRGSVIKLRETTSTRPVNLEYSAPTGSQALDVRGTIAVRDASTGTEIRPCGQSGVMCAEIDAKRLPPHVLAQIDKLRTEHGSDLRVLLDADGVGLANAGRPDLVAKVVTPPAANGRPTVLDAALKELPRFTRARIVDGATGGPERIELHPCRLVDAAGTSCEAGTAGVIGAVEVEVRDGVTMPSRLFDLPVTSPNHLAIISRGDRDDDEMNSRVVARATKVNGLSVLQRNGLLGVDSRLGGGQALSIDLEERAFDRANDERGPLDSAQRVSVPSLPTLVQVCLGEAGRAYRDQIPDVLTARCEGSDPFNDGTTMDHSPITFAYDANGPTSATALMSVIEGADTETTDDDRTELTEIAVENAPTALRAAVLSETLADGQNKVRGLVRLPNDDAAGTVVRAKVRDVEKQSSCDANAAMDGNALCADVELSGLPKAMSVLFDPSPKRPTAEVHACSWRLEGMSGSCVAGTEGTLGRVKADVRQLKPQSGPNVPLAELVPPVLPPVEREERQPCALCPPQPDPRPVVDDAFAGFAIVDDGKEETLEGVSAALNVGAIEHVRFARAADEFVLNTDMGEVYQRLALKAVLDKATDGSRDRTIASGLVDPLPPQLEMRVSTPAENPSAPVKFRYEASEPIDVTGAVELRPAESARSCTSFGVVCAEFGLNDVPEEVDLRLIRSKESAGSNAERRRMTVELDHDGSTSPDMSALVRMGPSDTSPTKLEVRGELLDVPSFTRLRLVQVKENIGQPTESDRLEQLSLHACDSGENGVCPTDATGSLKEASVSARTFTSRPANFPARPTLADAGAWVTERGQHMDAGAQIRFLRELTVIPDQGRIGVRTRLEGDATHTEEPGEPCPPRGCPPPPEDEDEKCEELGTCPEPVVPQDFAVFADLADLVMEDVEFDDVEWRDAKVDVALKTTISPLPASLQACYRPAQIPFVDDLPSLLIPCEQIRPFGDDETVDDAVRANSPLMLDYDAASPFDAVADVAATITGLGENRTPLRRNIAGHVELDDVPKALRAVAQFPVKPDEDTVAKDGDEPAPVEPTRLLYSAPTADDLPRPSVVFSGAMTEGDAVCGGLDSAGDVACFSGHVTGLPSHLSVLLKPGTKTRAPRIAAYACDRRFGLTDDADAEVCADGTEGEVQEIEISAHTADKDAGPLPPASGNPGEPHAVVAARTDKTGPMVDGEYPSASALRAHVLVRDMRELSVRPSDAEDEGFRVDVGVGDLADPDARNFVSHLRIDNRDIDGSLVDAEATVLNVAPRITVLKTGKASSADNPLTFRYLAPSNAATSVIARADTFSADAGPACGDDGTACARVRIDRLPGDLNVVFRSNQNRSDASHPDRITASKTEMTVDGPSAFARPDIEAHVVAGATSKSAPLALDADIDRIPRFVRLEALQARPANAPADDNEALGLEYLTLDACGLPITATSNPCATAHNNGTVDSVNKEGTGPVSVAVRTFTERPGGFPVIPAALPEGRDGLHLIGRSNNIEAVAKLTGVSRLAYERAPVTTVSAAAPSRIFDALVDLQDMPIGLQRFGEETIEVPALLDLKADLVIDRLPRAFTFCMRPASERKVDQQLVPAAPPGIPRPDPNRAPGRCDYDETFGPTVVEPGRTPMSIGWRAATPFDITRANFAATIAPVEPTATRKASHISGSGQISQIPQAFGMHLLAPRDVKEKTAQGGVGVQEPNMPNPTRVRYEASDVLGSVQMAFESRTGDAQCLDPRPGRQSLCVSAVVSQIPKTIDLVIEPKRPMATPCVQKDTIALPAAQQVSAMANLCFFTSGGTPFYVHDLSVRSAKPNKDGDQEFVVLDGFIQRVPQQITAEFTEPKSTDDKASFRFDASQSIERIDVTYRNTPEQVLNGSVPLPRDRTGTASGVGPDVVVLQRGKALDARVRVDNLRSAGYSPQRAADGSILPTERISLDFGPAQKLWVYADIITNGTEDSAPSHTIADVLAENVPTGIEVCFRSRSNTGLPTAAVPTYCDANNRSGGAFEFAGERGTGPLSVDAYIRSMDPSGKVFSARIAAEGIPEIVRGQFPAGDAGDVDFGGYRRTAAASTVTFSQLSSSQVETAEIANVFLDIADFDVQSTPYFTRPVYLGVAQPAIEAPIPAGMAKYVSARIKNGDMNIRANVGTSPSGRFGNGTTATQGIKRFRLYRDIKDADDCNQYPSSLQTAGYPALDGRSERYACVLVDFAHSPSPKNLGFNMEIDSSGKALTFKDVAIGRIPEFLKIIISPIEATVPSTGAFRPACTENASTSPADCAPPMLNIGVNNPSMEPQDNTAQLAGVITVRDLADTNGVLANPPTDEPFPNLFHKPSLAGWVNEAGEGSADIRISARSKRLDSTSTALTAQIALRITLPSILAVDPIGIWERKRDGTGSADPGVNRSNFYEARDLKLGIHSDKNGVRDFQLGRLALAFENADTASGQPTFLLLSDHDPARFGSGALIPGETELQLFQRDDKGEGHLFLQIDSKLSKPLDLGVRILDRNPQSRLPRARFSAAGLPAGTGTGPSGRIRATILTPQPDLPGDEKPDLIDREARGETKKCPPPKTLCAGVRLGGIDVAMNLANSSVRRVDAVVRVTGERNGVEIRGFDALTGGNRAKVPGVSAVLGLQRLRVHGGTPITGGGFFVDFDSQMIIPVSFTNASEMMLWHDKLAVNAQVHAPNASNTHGVVGPIEHHVRNLHASGTGFVLGATVAQYARDFAHNQQLIATRCGGFNIGLSQFSLNANRDDGFVFLDPIADGVFVGGAGSLGDSQNLGAQYGFIHNARLIQTIVRDNLCNDSKTIPIMTADMPGDPLIGDHALVFQHHPVPDSSTTQPVPAPPTSSTLAGTGDYTLNSFQFLSLCGPHSMRSLRVKPFSGIHVNYQPSSTLTPWGTESCPKGYEGKLDIYADTVTVDGDDPAFGPNTAGYISADGAWGQSTSTYNSGGGHAGTGGAGMSMLCASASCNATTGKSNDPAVYARTAPASADLNTIPLTEPGSAGGLASCDPGLGANRKGCGGGAITFHGSKVVVNGKITADGYPGENKNASGCSPSRSASGGGGAGGGIAFEVARVEGSGLVSARGGRGGGIGNFDSYAGGGGSGGVIKMPLYWTAPQPLVSETIDVGSGPFVFQIAIGGQRGETACQGLYDQYVEHGAPGRIIHAANQRHNDDPAHVASNVYPTEKVWTQGGDLRLAFNAGAPGSQHVWVWLCRTSIDPAQLAPGENPLEKLHNQYLQVSHLSANNGFSERVCGSDQGIEKMFIQNNHTFWSEGGVNPQDDGRIDPGEKPMFAPLHHSSGYHAYWTVASRPRDGKNGTNCGGYSDGSGAAFNAAVANCTLELRPDGGPDVIVAVDTAKPTTTITAPTLAAYALDGEIAHLTNQSTASFRVTATDEPNGASGLDRVFCTMSGNAFPCWDGETSRVTLPVEGLNRVEVGAVDRAGNVGVVDLIHFFRDTTPISGAAAVVRDANDDGKAGWHKSPPRVRLDRLPMAGSPNVGAQHFQFRFDGGDVGICSFDGTDSQDPGCLASPPSLGSGNHRFYWGGVDGVGNAEPLSEPHLPCTTANRCLVIKIDNQAPTGTAVAVPKWPTATGWHTQTPSVVIDVDDEPGGSGRGELKYTTQEQGKAVSEPLPYSGPVEVDEGLWTVCGVTEDEAGHTSTSEQCVSLKVDTKVPTAKVSFNGQSLPDSQNGPTSKWQQGPPTIVISDPSDATSGLVDQPIAYRVDGGAETTCNAPCTVAPSKMNTAGRHLVTWTVRDVAGNERPAGRSFVSPLRPPPYPAPGTIPVAIDKADPTVAVSVVPAASASGWITSRPTVSASSIDGSPGSGVDDSSTVLRVRNAVVASPMRLDDGVHTVCAKSTDGSGRNSESCTTVSVDTTAPTGDLVKPPPTGANGWYLSSPTLTINNVDDAKSGLPAHPVLYRIDDAEPVECAAPCVIGPDNFPEGEHTLRWQVVDKAGNYSDEHTVAVNVDLAAPAVDYRITPATSATWRPSAAFMQPEAFDAGSGAEEVHRSLDGQDLTGSGSVHRIGSGEHEVCYSVDDEAGRRSENCRTVRADGTAPQVTIAAPSGWVQGPYALPISASDLGESGVPHSVSTTCGVVLPPIGDRVPGICVSVDGAPFTPLASSALSLADGDHEVRAFAIDRAGHRSLVSSERVRVDSVAPTSTARVRGASVPGWWRHAPYVSLDGGDAASGISKVQYRFDPSEPWKDYESPLLVKPGKRNLYHRAIDRSGLVSPITLTEVKVDGGPPVVSPSSLQAKDTPVLRLFGTKLRWAISEVDSPTVNVRILVRDATNKIVRQISYGTVAVTNGSVSGSTTWDGKGTQGALVPPGAYTFRVIARDAAGKVTESTDSAVVVFL